MRVWCENDCWIHKTIFIQQNKLNSAPIICNTRILHNGMFKHEAAGEIVFPQAYRNAPMFSPFLGAGVIFSRVCVIIVIFLFF